MKLSVRSLTITAALLWALTFLFVSIFNYLWPPYGQAFLEVVSSIYPGYKVVGGLSGIIVGLFYALIDGAIGGALFGWIYNTFAS